MSDEPTTATFTATGRVAASDFFTIGQKSDPMDTFDVSVLRFPHPVGWCDEQDIRHHWRHILVHTFSGPTRSEFERYCINCGKRQKRVPEYTVPATPWADVET